MKLSPLHFQLSIIIIEKRLPDLASQGVAERKRQHRNRLFAHSGRLFPSEIREKDDFLPKNVN